MFQRTALTVCLLILLSPVTLAQPVAFPLSTSINSEEGEYLVDAEGMSLYQFKADTRGAGGRSPVSACKDAPCTGTWPPLLSERPVGDGKIDSSLLGTFHRQDGTTQVTYNGWPIYYYFDDSKPGDILGDDIESFGEDWYLISPLGNRPGHDEDRDDDDD